LKGGKAVARIQEHLAQWQHNRDFVQAIDPKYPDWIVTVALYLALHAVEALLTADGAKPRSRHQDRLQILQSEQRYQKIYESFKVLYDLSHVTRYSAQPGRWIPADQVEHRVIRELVYRIETSVRHLLSAARPPISVPPHAAIQLRRAIGA